MVIHTRTNGKAKEKDRSFLLFLFLSFNWKTQGAPSILATNEKTFCSYFYCLVIRSCLLDQSFLSCDKQMDGCHFLPTTDLQTDVYFLRENYMEHFNHCWFFFLFCLFGFSRSLPFLEFLQEEEDSSGTVLIHTQRNTTDSTDRCNKTLEFGKTTHTYMCYYTSVDLSKTKLIKFLLVQTIIP